MGYKVVKRVLLNIKLRKGVKLYLNQDFTLTLLMQDSSETPISCQKPLNIIQVFLQ